MPERIACGVTDSPPLEGTHLLPQTERDTRYLCLSTCRGALCMADVIFCPTSSLEDTCFSRNCLLQLTDAFMAVVENGIYLTHEVLSSPLPPHLRTNAELVAYGGEVQQRLRGWYSPLQWTQDVGALAVCE